MSFGLVGGVAVRLLVRSQHSIKLLLAIALSLAGAIAGQLAAERLAAYCMAREF